jgi:hypothetical protein
MKRGRWSAVQFDGWMVGRGGWREVAREEVQWPEEEKLEVFGSPKLAKEVRQGF